MYKHLQIWQSQRSSFFLCFELAWNVFPTLLGSTDRGGREREHVAFTSKSSVGSPGL